MVQFLLVSGLDPYEHALQAGDREFPKGFLLYVHAAALDAERHFETPCDDLSRNRSCPLATVSTRSHEVLVNEIEPARTMAVIQRFHLVHDIGRRPVSHRPRIQGPRQGFDRAEGTAGVTAPAGYECGRPSSREHGVELVARRPHQVVEVVDCLRRNETHSAILSGRETRYARQRRVRLDGMDE